MRSFLIILISLLCVIPAFSEDKPPAGRLPDVVRPQHYDLSLTVVPSEERFNGSVKVDIEFKSPVAGFWMHGQDLEVKEASLLLANGETLKVTYKQVTDDGVVRIDIPKTLEPQKAVLAFTYDAPFNHQLSGLYLVEEGGESYAFTQFQNISARRCFPSFDEPGFKTTYDITITAKQEHTVLANTLPVQEESIENGMKRIRFGRTPKLPTYLVAFVVGPMEMISGSIPPNEIRNRPIPLRAFSIKGKKAQLAHAMKTSPGLLEVLEHYFNMPYPYDKLDLIAVPDFEAGAMENAATITFREWALLLDEKNAPERQKKYHANTMAHELAHQWFGDLVTMSWWDDVWLNESFATWIAARAVKTWDPNSRESTAAVSDEHNVMGIDSMVSARQIRNPIRNTNDIHLSINWLTYAKGAAVIAMFERYLGAETFQKGIQHYLKKYENGNATTDDFLNSLSEVAQKDIAPAFRTFLFQPGVPLVDVRLSCKGDHAEVHLKQSRYLPVGSRGNPEQTWQFPICARFETNGSIHEKCVLLDKEEASMPLSDQGCPEWIIPNADAAGYYRWTLPPSDYAKLEESMDQLTLQEQLSLVDSISSGFQSGKLAASDVFERLPIFARSKKQAIAKSPMLLIEFSRESLVPESLVPRVEEFARSLYKDAYSRVGFDDESGAGPLDEETTLFRSEVIPFLAFVARDPEVRAEAGKRGLAYIGYGTDGKIHRDAVDVNLVSTCLGVALQEGDNALLQTLISLLKETKDPVLRPQIIAALGRVTNQEQVDEVLKLVLDPAIRNNEVFSLMGSITDEEANREHVWQWAQKNLEGMLSRLPGEHSAYLPFVGSRFCSEEKAKEVEEFFSPRIAKIPGGSMSLNAALERIHLCAAEVQAQRDSARSFFEKPAPAGPR